MDHLQRNMRTKESPKNGFRMVPNIVLPLLKPQDWRVFVVILAAVHLNLSPVAGGDLNESFARVKAAKELDEAIKALDAVAGFGEPAIPYLFRAINLRRDLPDNFDFHLRDLLATYCKTFPETFSKIIREDGDQAKRWMAVYAVRSGVHTKCDKALAGIFNNAKEHNIFGYKS